MGNFSEVFESDIEEHQEKCSVCQRPSRGKHYNVSCCHGCKSFFRRAITEKLKFPKCQKEETCSSDATKSNEIIKCRFCRYQKCFNVGMIPQFSTKRKKSAEQLDEKPMHIVQLENKNPYSIMATLKRDLAYVDEKMGKLYVSTYHPVILPDLKTLIEETSKFHLADRLDKMPGWPLEQDEYLQKHRALMILKMKMESGAEPFPSSSTEFTDINVKDWFPFDLMMTIEHAKTFQFFNDLDIADRMILIRETSVMVVMITVTYFSYKAKKEYVLKPDGAAIVGSSKHHVINSILASSIQQNEMERKWQHGRRLMSFLLRDKPTYEEFLFLRMIIFCNPASGLSEKAANIIQKERDKMGKSLFNYCLMEYGKHGTIRFTNLLNYVNIFLDHQHDFRNFVFLSQLFMPVKMPQTRTRLVNQILCIDLE
ncbi:unnamed protein product [Caenorhabditis angaria]|uniref:Uncharacterized protein n=1 Tax=Caenorhabditis angaria TaxID=860376 RepID=A0A9P1J238_9PELO|nr:unnamed protein product [Caenorhabditis angaria]